MRSRRAWEVGSAAALLLVLATAGGGSWYRGQLNRDLARAVGADDLPRIARRVRQGAAVDTRDRQGRTALAVAAAGCELQLLNELLARGATVDARDQGGATPLMHAASTADAQVLARLCEAGADPNAQDRSGFTALIEASVVPIFCPVGRRKSQARACLAIRRTPTPARAGVPTRR